VALDARKNGVGRALVNALAYADSQLQVRYVNLGVNALNIAALSLYEAHCFARIGFEPCFMLVDGEPQDEIHMACVLKSEAREGLKRQAGTGESCDQCRLEEVLRRPARAIFVAA